jgi:hypothetical protein
VVARYAAVSLVTVREVKTNLANKWLFVLRLPLRHKALADQTEVVSTAIV